MNSKVKVIGAARWSAASMLGRSIFQFLQLIFLARQFEAKEMGVVVLVFSINALAQIFFDFGLNNIVLYRNDLSKRDLDNIYGISLVLGAFILLLATGLGYPFSVVYNEPAMAGMLPLMGCTFFLNSIWQQRRILAEKEFHFSEIARAEIVASMLGFLSMCAAVIATKSVYAVMVAPIVISLYMAAALHFRFRNLIPWGFRLDFRASRQFLGFSLFNAGFSITNSLVSQLDVIIGARVLGAENIAGYGLAKDLTLKIAMAVNPAITRVASPLFARSQTDNAALKKGYLQVLSLTTFINFPIYTALFFFADSYTSFFFGQKWIENASLLSCLAVWGLFRSVGNPCGSLMFALGKARLAFYFSATSLLLFAPGYWFGSKFGVFGLAISLTTILITQQIYPVWRFIVNPLTGIKFFEYMKRIGQPLICALSAFCIGRMIQDWLGGGIGSFLASQTTSVCFYLLFSFLVNRKPVIDVLSFVGFKEKFKFEKST